MPFQKWMEGLATLKRALLYYCNRLTDIIYLLIKVARLLYIILPVSIYSGNHYHKTNFRAKRTPNLIFPTTTQNWALVDDDYYFIYKLQYM